MNDFLILRDYIDLPEKFFVGVVPTNYQLKIENWLQLPIDNFLFQIYFESLKCLIEYEKPNRHFIYMHVNYSEFLLLITNIKQYLRPVDDKFDALASIVLNIDDPLLEIQYIMVCQKLFNFLSSARTFLDYTEKYVKAKSVNIEKGYDVNAKYINLKQEEFDNKDSYMLLTSLRNFVQHQWFPPGSLRTFRTISGEGCAMTSSLKFFLNRDRYIDADKTLPVYKKDRIRRMEEEIDILPLVNDYYKSLRHIHISLLGEQYLQLTSANRNMNKIIEFVSQYAFIPVVLKKMIKEGYKEQGISINIPFYLNKIFDDKSIDTE